MTDQTSTPVTIEAGILARAMRDAAHIVKSTAVIPILANVRLVAEGDWLEVTTSDLDTEYRQRLPLRAPAEMATTVDARRLKEIANACDAGAQISLTLEKFRLTVRSGRSRWSLPALPVSDFPPMPADNLCPPLTVPTRTLADMIRRTHWCIGDEMAKPWYSGLSFRSHNGKFEVAAADGNTFILVASEIALPDDAKGIIVPSKYASTLQRLAADLDDSITLAWDEAKVQARIGEIVLTGKLVDYQFPDYRAKMTDPLEAKADVGICVDPGQLRAALRRVELVADNKSRAVRLALKPDMIEIGLTSVESGDASEEVAADCAEDHTATFNGKYLGPMLEAIGGDTIEIHHTGPGGAVLVRRKVKDGALGILMPMRF